MSKPVPSIPPISSIKDPATRSVLDALVNGWRLRNGQVGDGGERFITRSELPTSMADELSRVLTISQYNSAGMQGGATGAIGRLVDAMAALVFQSAGWRRLEERVAWINTPEWINTRLASVTDTYAQQVRFLASRIQQNVAVVATERQTRITRERAVAEEVRTLLAQYGQNTGQVVDFTSAIVTGAAVNLERTNTLQARMNSVETEQGQLQVSLQQSYQITTDIKGKFDASYTLKIDANGYIAGFDLGVNSTTAGVGSQFVVRADRFAIGSPAGPGIPPAVPFIVKTTPWNETVDGVTVTHPPGVYMTDVKIANASIDKLVVTSSLIAPGAVTTEKIPAGAVSDMVSDGATSLGGYESLSVSMEIASGYKAFVLELMSMVELFSGSQVNIVRSRVVVGPATATATLTNPHGLPITGDATVSILLMKR